MKHLPHLLIQLVGATALAAPGVYDPSLGTLPDAQGFSRVQDPAVQAEPTVSSGVLHQGLTVFNGIQGWNRTDTVIDFSGSAAYELVARLRVIASTYVQDVGDNTHRYGYYIWSSDAHGRRLALGFSSSAVAFDTQFVLGDNNPAPIALNTSPVRTYRVVASGGTGKLLVDGVLRLTVPLGPADIDEPNNLFFGDGTYAGESKTELLSLRFGPACPCDLNDDGLVDDADFTLFVGAYNTLDCADPSMPAGCPSDFNGDGLVDDTDFTIFVPAYNDLVCP
ncbi:MAG: hypothetical protein KF805_13005 [Phycisphaeraceae bacterium]|nr:hypothetical protein [Phycisphaeraceae bacterium]